MQHRATLGLRVSPRRGAVLLASLLSAACLAGCASRPKPLAATVAAPAVAPVAAPAAAAPQPAAASPAAAEPAPKPASISAEDLGLYRTKAKARAAPTADELKLVEAGQSLVGLAPNAKILVEGKQFTLDCIGTVCAIYYKLGIDASKDFDKYPGNGVNRLYRSLEARGVLHRDRYPRTGDVIFWDNTWDANGDGDRTNDPRTHAGIVMAVDEDGTIHYLHENMYKGVMIERMNLLQPALASDAAGKRINSSLAIATVSGGPKPPRFLAGDVFQAFGDVLRIKAELKAAAGGGGAKLGLAEGVSPD